MHCPHCTRALSPGEAHKCSAAKHYGRPPVSLPVGPREAKQVRDRHKQRLCAELDAALRRRLRREVSQIRRLHRSSAERQRAIERATQRALASARERTLRMSLSTDDLLVAERCANCGTAVDLAACTGGIANGRLVVTARCRRCRRDIAYLKEP